MPYRRAVSPFHDFPPGVEDPADYPHYGTDMYSTNITCGRNSSLYAATTNTATVLAGTEVGFGFVDIPNGWPGIFHGGATQIYLSKVPDGKKIESYEGNEDEAQWFKIASWAQNTTDNLTWLTMGWSRVMFDIPKTTPPGPYLLRIESQNAYYYPEMTQFFTNCAHVNIIGPGGGTPTQFVKFPGTYKLEDPGIVVSKEIYWGNLTGYKAPGPPPWAS
ncbi:hypothetical protein CC80DRAFT_543546 [Byssothecium circinans]|uniref:lytic cellulose monooxygenase (C4-dehydrogenating) n=1 Tax=Byssothecium circinans TaxID=147558 RepID=A0A6A5UJD5_9PLEO|nr:hypothetical protein CC80DRAFT_543546 [Byssothecium circinans]